MRVASSRERFRRALAGEPVDGAPVWFMRQAGRSLPGYRSLRSERGFKEICSSPGLALEATLEPVDRFGMDAAVVFSDILLPLEDLGFEVRYEEGVGPVVEDPLREPERVDDLPPSGMEGVPAQARTVERVRKARPDVGVVGFVGAPFTLACYLIEGSAPKRYEHVNRFRHEHPDAFERLLWRLARVAGEHARVQAERGADAVQVFDTHAEVLPAGAYAGTPCGAVEEVLDAVPDRAATIVFARGGHLLDALSGMPADAVSLDWRIDLAEAARAAPGKTLQGNLDPGLLQAPPGVAAKAARGILEAGRRARGHVFNLGHGVTPNARVETIQAVVDAVREDRG